MSGGPSPEAVLAAIREIAGPSAGAAPRPDRSGSPEPEVAGTPDDGEPPEAAAEHPAYAELASALGDLLASETPPARESALAAVAAAAPDVPEQAPGMPMIEALAREAMRPIIRDWLDANLPELAERLAGEEIGRRAARAGTDPGARDGGESRRCAQGR